MKPLSEVFPLKGFITQDIIDKSVLMDTTNCIGANTLKEALGENINLFDYIGWAIHSGANSSKERGSVRITTVEGIDLMEVKRPQEVTFIIPALK